LGLLVENGQGFVKFYTNSGGV